MQRLSTLMIVLTALTATACDRAETSAAAAPAVVAAQPPATVQSPAPAKPSAPPPELSPPPPAPPPDDPSAPRKATVEEAAETPLPTFVPAMPDAKIDGELTCPDGAQLYRTDRTMHCAIADSRYGKGRHGPSLSFHPGGTLASQGEYKDGKATGAIWDFDESGRLLTYWEVDGDDRHGLSASLHPNGKRASEGRFVRGKPDGVHKLWNEKGELMGTVTYREGERVSDRMFAYTLEEMTPAQLEQAHAEIDVLMAEQKRLVESMK